MQIINPLMGFMKYQIVVLLMGWSFFGCKGPKPINCQEFHELVLSNDVAKVTEQVKHGHDVNCTVNAGVTPLMTASLNGFTEIQAVLLDAGAAINRQTDAGWTALIYAADNGHLPAVKLLVERGQT